MGLVFCAGRLRRPNRDMERLGCEIRTLQPLGTVSRLILPHRVIHRADYHEALLDAAITSGAEIRLGASVKKIDFEKTSVEIDGGQIISANVIVGADGMPESFANH